MKISITSKALAPDKKEYFFRSGTVSALKKLTEFDFTLILTTGEMSEHQKSLLDQENISYTKSGIADFSISEDEGILIVSNADNETVFSSKSCDEIANYLISPPRTASVNRVTKETEIAISLNLEGTGESNISTGLNFFDHMLEQIARHGLVDLTISCDGDLEVDEHHTIEDVALALGETISNALGDKKGIERYGFVLPMDETQATVALDLSGRPYLVFDVDMKREFVGDFPTEMLEHFFYSLAMNLKATIHVSCTGKNDHHKIEACFKGFARALKTAIEQNGRIINQIPSSKGTL